MWADIQAIKAEAQDSAKTNEPTAVIVTLAQMVHLARTDRDLWKRRAVAAEAALNDGQPVEIKTGGVR